MTPLRDLPARTFIMTPSVCERKRVIVDVTGISIGKGFQGAMKRWGFKGQSATHGNSRSHRSLGSTGHRKTPGRTWKGKKIRGHRVKASVTLIVSQMSMRIMDGDVPVCNILYQDVHDWEVGAPKDKGGKPTIEISLQAGSPSFTALGSASSNVIFVAGSVTAARVVSAPAA